MSTLVSIQSRTTRTSLSTAAKVRRGPVVDKFFIVGALVGLGGMATLGSFLWMARSGLVPTSDTYPLLRILHAELQLLVFFGLFIVGFCIQAGPRLLNVESPLTYLWSYSAIVLPVLGLGLRYLLPDNALSPFLYAAAFVVGLVTLIRLIRQSTRRPPFIPFLFVSLLFFVAGCFLPIEQPGMALTIFWGAVGSAIIGVWHVFIGNLLGGSALSAGATKTVIGLHTLILATLLLFTYSGNRSFSIVSGGAGIALMITYIISSRGVSALTHPGRPMLSVASVAAWFWAMLAWLSLTFDFCTVDEALHLLATGFAAPLVIALSLHIVGHLSGREALPSRLATTLLLLWQVVPMIRGLSRPLSLPQESALLLAVILPVTLGVWIIGLLRSEIRIIRRQMNLQGNEVMVRD